MGKKLISLSDFTAFGNTFGKTESETVVITINCGNSTSYTYSNVNGVRDYGAPSAASLITCESTSPLIVSINSTTANGNFINISPYDNPLFTANELRCFYDNVAIYRFFLPAGAPQQGSNFQGNFKCMIQTLEPVPTSLVPCCPGSNSYYQVSFSISDSDVNSHIEAVLMSLNQISNLAILPNAAVYTSFYGDIRAGDGVVKLQAIGNENDQTCDTNAIANSIHCTNLVAFCIANTTFSINIASVASSFANFSINCNELIRDYSRSGSISGPIYLTYSGSISPTIFNPSNGQISISYIPYDIYEPIDPVCATGSSSFVFNEKPVCQAYKDSSRVTSEILYDYIDRPGVYGTAAPASSSYNHDIYHDSNIAISMLLGASLALLSNW
jgi:hypothetical protein